MTGEQASTFFFRAGILPVREFHHGDCVGADHDAAEVIWSLYDCPIICHPPVDETHRAFNQRASDTLPPKTHFARNRDIVDACDILVATPWQDVRPKPKTGGGTWYTIEYAEKRGKHVVIIWPDGSELDQPARSAPVSASVQTDA
jgi:hypothetical protein